MPQKPAYGTDGAYDARNGSAPQRSLDQAGTAAYGKGYNLSSPPIGASAQQSPPMQPVNNNPYPQSTARRDVRAPFSQKVTQQMPSYGRSQDEFEEGSLTPSDEYDDGPPGSTPGVPSRRFSKAERFFGIGDDGSRRQSTQQDNGGYVEGYPEKKKPGWKIWK
jgi:hypothetical protein